MSDLRPLRDEVPQFVHDRIDELRAALEESSGEEVRRAQLVGALLSIPNENEASRYLREYKKLWLERRRKMKQAREAEKGSPTRAGNDPAAHADRA